MLLVNILILIVYIIIAWIGYVQVRNLRKEKRIEFGYQLYTDLFNFLNAQENETLRKWLWENTVLRQQDWYRIGNLFEKFEAVYTAIKRNMIDYELFYDLFSFYLEKAFSANGPSGQEYIDFVRKDEQGKVSKTDDIFIGVEWMYQKIRSESATRKEPKLKFKV